MADAQAVAARFVDAFNAHDEARIRELTAEDIVFEGPGDIHLEGREADIEYTMMWLTAFPDARLTVHNEFAAGDWIVQELTFEGTHTAALQGPTGEIAATNRSVIGRCAQIFKVEGDAVIDFRLYYDQVQLLTQLGLMPEAAAQAV